MINWIGLVASFVGAVCVSAMSARAEMSAQLQACMLPSLEQQMKDPERVQQIKVCTTLFQSKVASVDDRASAVSWVGDLRLARYDNGAHKGDMKEVDLAIAAYSDAIALVPTSPWYHLNRAKAWRIKGNLDRAIEDLTQQIKFNPKRQEAYKERGDACRAKGDFDCAIADYSQQIKLIPFFWGGYLSRGQAHFLKGDYRSAIPDLERANRNVNGFTMLWLYLARARGGSNGTAELQENVARLKSEDWPFQLVDFYLGRRPESQILTGMGVMLVIKLDRRVVCQSNFYVGEWNLLRNNRTAAEAAFKEAASDQCPKLPYVRGAMNFDGVEYDGAVAELKRLRR